MRKQQVQKILLIHPNDNLIVALKDLAKGEMVKWQDSEYTLIDMIPTKHKFTTCDLNIGDIVYLYGVPVGKATQPIKKGGLITTENLKHYAAEVELNSSEPYQWSPPDVHPWENRSFQGYARKDGRIGTANYWLIIPLVFCQNRNVQKMQEALALSLGYSSDIYRDFTKNLLNEQDSSAPHAQNSNRPFKNIDGIRAITVNGGCGGTSYDAESLCRILAAYADHPNVGGITVFSLGCEKAQKTLFDKALKERNPEFDKPYLFYRQQDWNSENALMKEAIRETLTLLPQINQIERTEVPLSKLKIGVKCGGSDGFSGISANPAMGIVSDIIVTLGGGSVLAEFPELCGAEGDIIKRCIHLEDKQRFIDLMDQYERIANQDGTSISDNPSPGNIKDGLITDAIKSTGASKKAGSAPISHVDDYGKPMLDSGLSLTCTSGNDLEAVTGQVAAGANLVIFSTGLGTPTGNPIVPVLKIATNTYVAEKMSDIIDFDCGPVIDGEPLENVAHKLLDRVVEAASGTYQVKADRLEQYDFLFWKRKTSL